MDPNQERDEFRRIELVAQLERARGLIQQYEEHQAYFRNQVEQAQYELGAIDQRLGGKS